MSEDSRYELGLAWPVPKRNSKDEDAEVSEKPEPAPVPVSV